MSKCNNVNTPEFVTLKKAFKSQFKANSIVNKWQAITSLDRLPTVDEAKQLVSNEEALFTADKLELGNAILNNLVRLNFIEKVRGGFVVKNSTTKDYNRNLIENNVDRIWNYLAINNINSDAIEYTKNPGKGVYINVNVDNLKKRDIIAARNSLFKGVEQQQNNTRTRHVVAHLKRIFPDVKVEFMSVKEAYDYYMNKPKEQRKSKFENVKSFYDPKTGTAILIKERLTDDIAIEEILHPFINSLELDNKALYDNLLVEAKTNFPKLKEEIEEGYSDSKGFTQEYRDKELVTQSLARHFRFEFENKPTNTFKELVKQFLDWFKNIINNIHTYITGTEIGQPIVQEETLAATSKGTLFAEDIVQNRLNIDSKYKGKIIFASSGIGKSFAKELNGRIIDSDQVYASILGVSVAELLDKLISLTWNEKKLVLKKLRTTLKSLAEEGFTVLTPTESLIDIADFAFIQGNPEQMAANTRNENRENPYEQTIVEAKERINRYKQRLKKADLELVILDENEYLSNYIFVEKNPIERISRDANTLLNKKLVTYLANFGISVRELKNIQEQLNIDALGFVDMLNKVAYVDESDSKELPYLAGKFIAHMLQYNPLLTDIYAELRNAVQSADKNELLDQIGIMIGDRLLGITSTPERLALSIRIIKLIDKLFAYFLEMIGKINYTQINKNVGIIVEGILADNKNMITASRYKPGAEGKPVKKVFFQSALKKDKFASIIVNQFAKAGFILTGSVTLSEQGSIYRPIENQVHDLDWVSPYNRKVTREKFKELYPEAIFIRDILNDAYVTDTYVIAPEGYKIENIEIVGERKTVLAYDVVSKKTNEVKGTYRLVDKKEVMTGVEGKLIDFFSYPLKTNETDTSMFVMLPSGQKLAIAEFQKTFSAKLSFQRLKDIWDYNRYIPFEEFRQLINNAKEYSTLGKTKVKELESITPVQEAETTLEEAEVTPEESTGKQKNIALSDISPEATLSDIAKLLNTKDVVFDINHQIKGDIQFSLSPERNKLINNIKSGPLGNKPNALQLQMLNLFTHASKQSSKEVDGFVATSYLENQGVIVELNEADHTYKDNFGQPYMGTTTAISGTMKNKEDVALNLAVGNDFDSIVEGIILKKSFDEIFKGITKLNREQADRAYSLLYGNLKLILKGGTMAIPQVVVFDVEAKIAGMIDILVVMPNGKLKIIDLKTAKHSVNRQFRGEITYESSEWDLEDDSLLKQLGLTDVLSTKAKQSIQIGVYQRMLENMGYEISKDDDALSTFHIQVGITGKGKDQVFDGTFKVDEWLNHNPMENLPYVDALVPLSPLLQLDIAELEEIAAEQKITPEELLGQELMLTDGELINEVEEFNVIAEGLKNYKGALIKRREAIEKIRSSVYMDRSKEETVEYIQKTISMISIVLSSRNITEAKVLFSNLVRDSIKQVDSFKEYLENPINVNDTNYITYALNIERFAVTYQGLHAVKGGIGLAKRQTDLLFILQSKLNELVGTHSDERSTVDQAILDFVMNIIAKNTLEDNISKEDLWKIVTEAKDISGSEWMTRDMATSTDRILAIMNKLYHNDKMKVIDNVQKRAFTITSVAEKLFKLSVSSDPQEIYDFMLNLNENNEWDGTYLREIGSVYYDLFYKYKDATYDEGSPMYYIDIKDPTTATAKEIQFNIDLANKKDELTKFMAAESYDNEGGYSDGMYHRWNKEFTDARKKHERWVSYGRYGEWVKKANVTRRAWSAYRAKYYRESEYKAVKRGINGRPTGVTFETTREFIKTEYREIRKTARNGDSMLSDRYKELISPTDALGRAQLEFYNMFRDMFEKKLLTKLPMGIRGQMLGRAPVVPGKLFTSLKKKPNFVVGLWARMTRSVENLITDTTEQRAVVTDERGNPVDGIPILFTGRPRDEVKMKKIQEEITVLKNKYKNFEIKADAYKKQIKILNGKYLAIRSKPSTNEVSRDLGTSLLKFSQMAEHYEVMTAAEDTFNSMIKVLENRDYQPSGQQELGEKVKGVFRKKGVKTKGEANVVKRAKNFMHMVYYDDEHLTKGKVDKVVDGLIKYTSLSYVAFNPFGSFNNFVYGKISNNIEALGQRHFKLKSYYRAEYEFTKRAIPSLIHRMSSAGEKLSTKSFYDPKLPGVLYDSLVDEFKMMDDKGDLRESGDTTESYFQRLYNFGYYMQDAAEYNVQTKVGMAILMDTMIKNSKTGDISTLYDAYGFDSTNKKAVLKEGYDTIVTMDRNDPTKVVSERAFDTTFKYNLRSKIREVNKQIHGNYARDDRMVMQTFAVGKLAGQFHKWVAPALRARFQTEYFDENLGWMEGRYIALGKYLAFVGKHIMKGDLEFGTYNEKFVEHYRDQRGTSEQHYQKGTDKLMSFKKTTGELIIIGLTILLGDALAAMWGSDGEGDDDELSSVKSTGDVVFLEDMSEHIKRFRNYLRYQADRSKKDMVLFIPIPGAGGLQQMYQMFKSPIASTRTLGELGEAISLSIRTPLGYLWYDEETFWSEKAYVYQRGSRKGELKLNKNWADAVPIWYAMKKWVDYSNLTNFFIK